MAMAGKWTWENGGSYFGVPSRFVAAVPVSATSNANNVESRPDLDEEPAIAIRQPRPAAHPPAQNKAIDVARPRSLCLKPQLRLEQHSRKGQKKSYQSNHDVLTLGDS